MCGYQVWFRCPDDGSELGWIHWSRDRRKITPKSLTFEMWPDMTEYSAQECFPASGFTYPDGRQASLFSSVHPTTVERHFQWMKEYGLDGVFLQRFLVALNDRSMGTVLKNVRQSAASNQRTYAICYDMSGMGRDQIYAAITEDWKRLVDTEKITQDPMYLHHHGKPVVFVWGFYSDRFPATTANEIIDFFTLDPKYSVTLIGGCQWYWRKETDPEWSKAFRRLPIISPWNVGNTSMVNQEKHASVHYWKEDLDEARKFGQEYYPVVYPGFAWQNLKGPQARDQSIPRLQGRFYSKQFQAVAELGLTMAYAAMFDEVDEGTALFKISNSPPTEGHFETLEGLPSDTYLKLTKQGADLLRRNK